MADALVTNDTSRTPTSRRWLVLTGLFGIALALAAGLGASLRPTSYAPSIVRNGVSSSHCTQFIALAKARFGTDWHARLDPRDTTCAQQVQQEWQSDWNPRPFVPPAQSTLPIVAPETLPVANAPSPTDARIRNPETYCLNVISLAQARYGPDWSHKVTPDETSNCGEQIHRMGSQ